MSESNSTIQIITKSRCNPHGYTSLYVGFSAPTDDDIRRQFQMNLLSAKQNNLNASVASIDIVRKAASAFNASVFAINRKISCTLLSVPDTTNLISF